MVESRSDASAIYEYEDHWASVTETGEAAAVTEVTFPATTGGASRVIRRVYVSSSVAAGGAVTVAIANDDGEVFVVDADLDLGVPFILDFAEDGLAVGANQGCTVTVSAGAATSVTKVNVLHTMA